MHLMHCISQVRCICGSGSCSQWFLPVRRLIPNSSRLIHRQLVYNQNLSTCEPAAKTEGFCRYFIPSSHTPLIAAALHPNGSFYSRNLIQIWFQSLKNFVLIPLSTWYSQFPTLLLYSHVIPIIVLSRETIIFTPQYKNI